MEVGCSLMSAVALHPNSQEHCTGGFNQNTQEQGVTKMLCHPRAPTQTKSPPPFRLASLINRKSHTFKTPTHHRKNQTFSGQTEPRNRKSREQRESRVTRKSREIRKSGVTRKHPHWRDRGSVWPVISSVSRKGGGCRQCGFLPARAGWPNGMEVG